MFMWGSEIFCLWFCKLWRKSNFFNCYAYYVEFCVLLHVKNILWRTWITWFTSVILHLCSFDEEILHISGSIVPTNIRSIRWLAKHMEDVPPIDRFSTELITSRTRKNFSFKFDFFFFLKASPVHDSNLKHFV
jgi:hypothetical protein